MIRHPFAQKICFYPLSEWLESMGSQLVFLVVFFSGFHFFDKSCFSVWIATLLTITKNCVQLWVKKFSVINKVININLLKGWDTPVPQMRHFLLIYCCWERERYRQSGSHVCTFNLAQLGSTCQAFNALILRLIASAVNFTSNSRVAFFRQHYFLGSGHKFLLYAQKLFVIWLVKMPPITFNCEPSKVLVRHCLFEMTPLNHTRVTSS